MTVVVVAVVAVGGRGFSTFISGMVSPLNSSPADRSCPWRSCKCGEEIVNFTNFPQERSMPEMLRRENRSTMEGNFYDDETI